MEAPELKRNSSSLLDELALSNALDSMRSDLAGVYNNLLNVGLGVLFVLATLSNSQLLSIFIKRPGLRSLSNQFIINLLITNIAACWSIVPILYYDTFLYDDKEYTAEFRQIVSCVIEGITAGMCTASVFSVVLIAVDQYFAVLEPLRYHSIIRKRATWKLFLMSWVISFLVGLMGVANTFYSSAYATVYPILFSLIIFLIPFVIICYIYFCIYWAAHENSLRTQKNCSSSLFNECSNSELRISHDSILKEKGGEMKFKNKSTRCKCSSYQKPQSHEPLVKKHMKHESKPLLVKDRKCKHINTHKGSKVSKPNDLYPITSIEDIDLLTEMKSAPVTPEKTLDCFSDDQIIMKIDSRNNLDTAASDSELSDSNRNDLTLVSEPVTETSLKQPMFYITKNNNTILKMNNNLKVSPLNRQLISNTIVTSLAKNVSPSILEENKDFPEQSLASDQNTSSVISLSQVDDYSSLASSLRNNESIVSLSSYNPSLASSVSDITLSQNYNDPVVSYFIYDELLSAYFCDKDFLSSLNVTDLTQENEPVTSLKGKDRYVRISLGCYNGIENVHVCNSKPVDVIYENINCDKLSCKDSKHVGLRFSRECSDDSSQPESTDDKAASVSEQVINNGLTSEVCDKQLDQNLLPIENVKSEPAECTPSPEQANIDEGHCESRSASHMQDRSYVVDEKRAPQYKGRMFKKNSCTDDRRKQFYENERRKSNDSKCSSDDNMDCQYYRNMEVFHSHKEKTRSIDSVVSRSGVKSFHHSSTRSSLKSTSSTLVNSLKHRFSNASMFRYREESRTAKISLSVIIMALFSWLPFTVLLLLHSPLFNVINYCRYSSFTFEKFAILCLSFHFVFSPLLFALRNKKIKREMIKMWRNVFCFFRKQDEEETRLRNSFYNDYNVNKQRIKALKEKQRLESQIKVTHNAETMTSEHFLSVEPIQKVKSAAVHVEQNNNTVEKAENQLTSSIEEKISFLSRLLAMKQKCRDSTKTWGNKCLKLAHASTTSDTQRSSISSNTVSTSTTDVCNEV